MFAADNGIVAEGVASTPQCVTLAQAINMTRGKTGMSAIARDFGIDVEVIDVGINSDSVPETILDRKLGFGTANFSKQPAMTRSQAVDALAIGIEAAERAHNSGADALGIGEMGIGNTTTSAAVLACLLNLPVESVTGRGSGLTDEGFALKNVLFQMRSRCTNPTERMFWTCCQRLADLISPQWQAHSSAVRCSAFPPLRTD